MGRTVNIFVMAAAAVFLVMASDAAMADSLEVSPTNLIFDADGTGVLNVMNRGNELITAQVEAFDWTQKEGKDQLAPSNTLQVSPPMVRLAPGKKQIVRVRTVPNAMSGSERAFRLVVSELPSPSSKIANGVRMLLQFKVPVFVGGTNGMPRQLTWSATPSGNNLILHGSNGGTKHVKLAKLQVIAASGQVLTISPGSFYYVLSGATRDWTIPEAGITSGAQLRIEGVDESNGTKIDTTVVAGH